MGFTFEEFPDADYYKSDLRKILKYIREVNAYLKTLDAIIEELREGLARLDGIENKVDALDAKVTQLDTFVAELGTRVNAVENDIASIEVHLSQHDFDITELYGKLRILEIDLAGIYQYVDDKYAELLAKTDEDFNLLLLKLNQAKVQLQSEIDELRERIDSIDTDVYNPWMARRVTQQGDEDFTYNHLADECLTASEYCRLGYTAAQYKGLDITSRDYQEFGKNRTRFNWVYSPVYGYRQELNNVLCGIVNYLSFTMRALDYASLDLDADGYSALDLAAADYVRYNPFIGSGTLVLDPNGTGLTSEQYSHISVT